MTATAAQRLVDAAFAVSASDERIATATQAAERRAMELATFLEWYGADLEVAIALNDVVLFQTTVKRLRARIEGISSC